MDDLSLIEEMILWAVWKLGNNAYGVTIRRYLSKRTNRLFPYGTLYGTLAKLARKGLVVKSAGDPSPVRGGRSRNYYWLTIQGREALKTALSLKNQIWDRESQLNLEKG
ncbi:MAG: helix-turn-helix transcriptional regulator [Candidatus Aminicenantes bacterium]|nr:helix-turn-helix transcriptional regulator [Candidatus Aminicenantes bacterium]